MVHRMLTTSDRTSSPSRHRRKCAVTLCAGRQVDAASRESIDKRRNIIPACWVLVPYYRPLDPSAGGRPLSRQRPWPASATSTRLRSRQPGDLEGSTIASISPHAARPASALLRRSAALGGFTRGEFHSTSTSKRGGRCHPSLTN